MFPISGFSQTGPNRLSKHTLLRSDPLRSSRRREWVSGPACVSMLLPSKQKHIFEREHKPNSPGANCCQYVCSRLESPMAATTHAAGARSSIIRTALAEKYKLQSVRSRRGRKGLTCPEEENNTLSAERAGRKLSLG